jgi:hypothetical protein
VAALKDNVKSFIVQALACYDTPSQVAEAVKEKFGLVVTRQQVSAYHPEHAVAKWLSKRWKDLFAETRKKFLETTSEIPIANQAVRLRVLQRSLTTAETRGNIAMVLQILEQASKEVGGSFTNRRELTGKDGKDLGPATGVLVAPAPAASDEAWEAQASKGNGSAG